MFLFLVGLARDHSFCVLAVVCGENLSINPIIWGSLVKAWLMFFLTVFLRLKVFYSRVGFGEFQPQIS